MSAGKSQTQTTGPSVLDAYHAGLREGAAEIKRLRAALERAEAAMGAVGEADASPREIPRWRNVDRMEFDG